MNNNLAKVFSALFHPLLMPLIGVVFIFYSGTYASYLPSDVKRIILLVVGANTLGLPLLMMPLFMQFGVVKSLAMESNKERILPLAFTLIPYILSVYFLIKLPIPFVIAAFMLGASLVVASCLIISYWWKISIHMVGIGGLVGFIIAFSIRLYADVLPYLLISIFIAALLASSRLQSKAHKPVQVYLGFILGFLIMLLVILIF
ncbi:MAG: PAP2 family protein [Bacteroidales bacterium]|nr:MAG: PAP2 family protein [Bacteroidales bacterium]